MTTPQMPTAEHARFDAICAPVDDFEPLPTVMAPVELEEEDREQPEGSLDDLILAGLVAPY